MKKLHHNEKVHMLTSILESYAIEAGLSQVEALKIINNFANNSETNEKEQILELVNAIHDGIAYGNWPWILNKK